MASPKVGSKTGSEDINDASKNREEDLKKKSKKRIEEALMSRRKGLLLLERVEVFLWN